MKTALAVEFRLVLCLFLATTAGGVAALAAERDSFHLIPERRLVSVETASPAILVLVFHDHDENAPPSQAVEDYAINGTPPRQVGRCTATLYEERCVDWPAQRYPQLLGHRLYLALPAPLAEGRPCEVRFPGGQTNFTFRSREISCESFKVNQVGYHAVRVLASGTITPIMHSMFTSRVCTTNAAASRSRSRSPIGSGPRVIVNSK